MKQAGAALLCGLSLLAAPAAAQEREAALITALDPPSLAAALRGRNYTADVRRTDQGAWFIAARLNAIPFQAILLNCAPGTTRCTDAQLFARIEAEGVTPARINEWNRRARFVRAYLDPEGRPVLEMDLSVEGGAGPGAIAAQLDLWGGALQAFAAHVSPARTPARP